MAAELAGKALLSAVLNPLVGKLGSEVVKFFKGKEDIVKLVKELETRLSLADLLLDDAEEKLITDQNVKQWLDDLKDTIYSADDLVYKIDTERLRDELEGESQSNCTCKVLTKLIPTPLTAFDKAIKPDIEEILGKLKILLENKDLGLRRMEKQKPPERPCAPLVEESDVYGRTDDIKAIIKLLLDDPSDDKLSVIPIVGMGGIGKTTLAQLVYNDERVQKTFDTKEWVTVGDNKVDLLKVTKAIIEKVTRSKEGEIVELFELQTKLKNALIGKKFLFVLDDIWDENPHKWDALKSSFESGLCGSKILVTTRSKVVASIMKNKSIHQLDPISDDDGWRLFAKHALIDANSFEYSYLQVVGREIVCKCKGLPLAIKSLGGLLRDKRNKEEWESILNSNIWELYERSSIGLLPALWLSYYYLPSHLKPCFAYCAIFPKDYEFVKKYVILLWMAEGFLRPKNGKRMEEVGEEYFQDLISRSFFQPANKNKLNFLMHDLMHDLAIYVHGEFCLEMNDTSFSNCARKIRHLSYNKIIDVAENFEGLYEAKGLRTFLRFSLPSWVTNESLWMENLLESLLRAGGCLRVLSLAKPDVIRLPASIGDLKYLKYLNLSNASIQEIPDTICNLYNLQIFLLKNCSNVKRLPTNIGNLINLRHLSIPADLEEMPVQIGKMKNLQSLNKFIVGKTSESGIKLLKELQDLHGSLGIYGIQGGVADVKNALEAGLKNKKFLSKLDLNFGNSPPLEDSKEETKVLDALKPHASLKSLHIFNYKGNSFPDWVGDHLYSNLVQVGLFNCYNCCSLPPLGQLSSLKKLVIWDCNSVERISSEFYSSSVAETKPFRSLETLDFVRMPNLREWSFIEGEIEGGLFPCLTELVLKDCPKLKVTLPDYLPFLRKLRIKRCDQLQPLVPRAQQMDTAYPSLETLKIHSCSGQDSLLEGGLPSSLKQIRVLSCHNLKALDDDAFQCLTSLEMLEINRCYKLQCLPRGLPTSLSYLSMRYCDLLTPRVQRDTGEDWPIIVNIPTIVTHDLFDSD